MSEGSFSHQATCFGADGDMLAEIGQQLRKARQNRGEDLYDVADLLRIKPSYLFALEDGDHAPMPGASYALGFLRSYADHLGLDGQKLVRRIKAGRSPVAAAPELHYPIPSPGERRSPVLTMLGGLVILVLGYGGWSYLIGARDVPPSDPVAIAPVLTAEQAPLDSAVPTSQQPPAATGTLEALVMDPPSGSIGIGPSDQPAPTAPVLASAEASAVPGGEVPVTGSLVGAAGGPEADATTAGSEPVGDAPVVADAGRPDPGVGAALAAEARVVLIAIEPSWIQVRSADRQFSRSRLMEAGEHFPLPERSDLALWTGNAGGLQVMVDGNPLQPLGARGAVLRNVPLDPAALKARTAPQ